MVHDFDAAISLRSMDRVPPSEFLLRQDRARSLARERGFDALVVWSRGAGTYDRFAPVYYLSNYYASGVFTTPDTVTFRGHGSGHAVLLLPVDGPSVLIVDRQESEIRRDLAVADRIVHSVGDLMIGLMRELDGLPENSRLGLVGTDIVSFPWYQRLLASIIERVVEADDLVDRLQIEKSGTDLNFLRSTASLAHQAMTRVLAKASDHATEAEAFAAAVEHCVAAGGQIYYGQSTSGPKALATVPTPALSDPYRRPADGDIASFGLIAGLDGYAGIIDRTIGIGHLSERRKALLRCVGDTVAKGCSLVRAGRRLGDIAQACEDEFERRAPEGAVAPGDGVWGCSVGVGIGGPWIMKEEDTLIVPGMVLSIRATARLPGIGVASHSDEVEAGDNGATVLTQ